MTGGSVKLLGGPLGLSFAPWLKRNMPMAYRRMKPIANWYCHIAGWRQMGLRYDDLICEERDDVQKALSRLSPRESYDRVFRMRRAFQQDIQHKPLPPDQWIKPEEDVRYLVPLIKQVVAEEQEREQWDSIRVIEKKGKH